MSGEAGGCRCGCDGGSAPGPMMPTSVAPAGRRGLDLQGPEPLDDGLRTGPDGGTVLDVRVLGRGRKHPAIFGLYDRLAPGESFVLLNDHDPKPLRSQFDAQRPGAFTWEYLEEGPVDWRVRIGRR